MMKKRIFCFTLFLLIQLLASLAAAAPTVNISDDHALETDLNRAVGNVNTQMHGEDLVKLIKENIRTDYQTR